MISKMKENVIIIGASGHGKVIADIIKKSGDHLEGFLDDNLHLPHQFIGFPILGNIDSYKKYSNAKFIIAIGKAATRERISKKLTGVLWYTAIHPSSVISSIDVSINEGTVIMATAVINSGAVIGKHCIINSGAIIEHDNVIDDFVHISVGAQLAGNIHVGKRTWIGIGATINNNISICNDCIIGAGGVVIRNITESGIYIGVPAIKS